MRPDEFETLLDESSPETQRAFLKALRRRIPLHPIEREWNVSGEVILEAISRSSDLSKRGVVGLITEAIFEMEILPALADTGWAEEMPDGNHSFDFRVSRDGVAARIQIKNQRSKAHQAMLGWQIPKRFLIPGDAYVAETQRTRAGKGADGKSTRPYRFDEFDILGVNMRAATGDWTQFRYTLSRWLNPLGDDPTRIETYQPVSLEPNQFWTDDLAVALDWLSTDVEQKLPLTTPEQHTLFRNAAKHAR